MASQVARRKPSPSVVLAPPPHKRDYDTQTHDTTSASALEAYRLIAEEWKLSGSESAALIGVDDATWEQMRTRSKRENLEKAVLERIAAIVSIYASLHSIMDRDSANSWIKTGHIHFSEDDREPIEVLIAGGTAMLTATRDDLEAAVAGL